MPRSIQSAADARWPSSIGTTLRSKIGNCAASPTKTTGLAEQLGNREHRADAHFVGLAADDGETAEITQRFEPALFGQIGVHDHGCRRAVGKLAGVAGCDIAALEHRFQRSKPFLVGAGPVAFVALEVHGLFADLAGLPVLDQHDRGQGDDFIIELAGLLGGGGAQLARQRVFILRLAADVIAPRHGFSGIEHIHVDVGPVLAQPWVLGVRLDLVVGWQLADDLDAAADADIDLADHDALRDHGDGLQAGRTETVDGCSTDADRHAGAHGADPRHIHAGLALRKSAADEYVFDLAGVDARPRHRMFDSVAHQVHAVGIVERAAVRLTNRRTRGRDDYGFGHRLPSRSELVGEGQTKT